MSSSIFTILLLTLLSLAHSQITVTGTGTVSAPPDTATFSVGVTNTATTAAAALSANNAASRRLLQLLIRLGISQRDIQTSFFNIDPQFARPPENPPRIVGYRVSNNFRVIVRDLDKLGAILDAVVRAGSNDVGGVSFSIENTARLLATARTRAVADATLKATTFARAAKVKVGKILAISEPGTPSFRGSERSFALEADSSVPVATGELDVVASVVLSFAIL